MKKTLSIALIAIVVVLVASCAKKSETELTNTEFVDQVHNCFPCVPTESQYFDIHKVAAVLDASEKSLLAAGFIKKEDGSYWLDKDEKSLIIEKDIRSVTVLTGEWGEGSTVFLSSMLGFFMVITPDMDGRQYFSGANNKPLSLYVLEDKEKKIFSPESVVTSIPPSFTELMDDANKEVEEIAKLL